MGMLNFWEYSSRNRPDHMPHPLTSARYNLSLELWAGGSTQDRICEIVNIDLRTLSRLLARARRAGDARAVVRHPATLKAMELAK